MKMLIVAAFVLFGLCESAVCGQESGQQPMVTAKPSPEHAILKQDVGVWDADITVYIPGQDPVKSKGVETNRMIGEFWLVSDFEYEVMGNKSFGHGSFGFDPSTGKYVASWIGSDGAYASHLIGDYDTDSRTFTYALSGKDPAGTMSTGKITVTNKDAGHRHFEMFMAMGDEMMKWMEVDYTKRN
jgi:hypothetical protein